MEATAAGAPDIGGRLRVAHLLVAGDVDGIGLHVRDLACAQLEHGTVEPILLTSPSPGYQLWLKEFPGPLVCSRAVWLAPAALFYGKVDLKAMGVDLVHLHGYRASHLVPVLKRRWRLPLIATCHLLAKGSRRREARARMEIHSYRSLEMVITTNLQQRSRITSAIPRLPVVYIPNGVAIPPAGRSADAECSLRTRFGFPPGCDVVAAVGRLHPQKRPDLFLQACRWISAELPGTRFLVVGDGPERKGLEKLARAVGLTPVIHFAGMVEDVPQLCRGISLLLHCADNEGTPRAVLHAMAAGCAVIATSSAGTAELITDRSDGVLVPCGDASGIAKQAVRLLQRPESRWELGQRARLRVESGFSIDLMRGRVEDAYRSVMSTSPTAIEESL